MDKKKILILFPGFKLFGQEQGLLAVATAMRQKDIDSHFLVHKRWGQDISNHLRSLNFEYTYISFGSIWSLSIFRNEKLQFFKNLYGLFSTTFSVLSLMRSYKFTHILAGNSSFLIYLFPVLFFTRRKIRLIYRHGDELPSHSWFHRLTKKIIMNWVDLHIFNCNFLRNKFTDAEKFNSKIIYNCPQRFKKNTISDLEINNSKISILYLGQLAEHKGIFILFEAFSELALNYPNLQLDIVGDFPGIGSVATKNVQKPLNNLLKEFPKRLKYHGFKNNPELYFKQADVLAVPSVWDDPSPNTIIEAKFFGVPSVAFNVGGIPELIDHGKDGFICKDTNVDSFAKGIDAAIKDELKLKQLKINARASFEKKFGHKRFISEWQNVFMAE